MLKGYHHDMMRIYYVLLFFLAAAGYGIHGCLTWELGGHSIRFICKIEDNSRTVHLVDNHEQTVARCTLNGSSGRCSSFKFVKASIKENLVTFEIDVNLKKDVDGNWTCLQKDNKFMSEVSTSRDLADITIVNLFGKIIEDNNVQKLLLRCSSCRIPKGKNTEFLLNNSSVDSITLDNETGKCTHLYGECISSTCECSPTGNTFDRIFLLERSFNTATYFSCKMRFEDKLRSEIFSKVTTVHFNGKEFTDKGTRTVITKLSDDHNNPIDEDGDTEEVLVAIISAITVMAFILFVGIRSYIKGRNQEKKKDKSTEEAIPLIGRNQEKKKDKSTEEAIPLIVTKDQIIQVNLEEPIMLHGNSLQCKLCCKEPPTRRDIAVMTSHTNSDDEVGGEDSTALVKDPPYSDINRGSISTNDFTGGIIQIEPMEYIDNDSKCRICGMKPYTKAETNDQIVQVNFQEDIILPNKSSKGVTRNHVSDLTKETNDQMVKLNYQEDDDSTIKNAQNFNRSPKSDEEVVTYLNKIFHLIGATEVYRRTCQRACITWEIISTFLGSCTYYAIGGAWEGTVTPGVQKSFGVLICDDSFPVIDGISRAHQNKFSLKVVRESYTPTGYVKLQFVDRSQPYKSTNLPVFHNKFNHIFKKDRSGRNCFTGIGGKSAYVTERWCYHCKEWPIEAQEWLSRSRCYGWPTPYTINELKLLGYFVLRRGHPYSSEKHLEWKISFTLQERALVFNLTDVQHECYVVLQMINRDIIDLEFITTYHWKTCLFYVIEGNKIDKRDGFGETCVFFNWLRICIKQMLKWVECGCCPNYFIPKDNLFGRKLDDNLRKKIENKLIRLLEDKYCCLSHVKSNYICELFFKLKYNLEIQELGEYIQRVTLKAFSRMNDYPAVFAMYAFNQYQANTQYTNLIELLWLMLHQIKHTETISEHTRLDTLRSLSLLTPVIYTKLAGCIAAMSIRQPNLQVRDFLLLGSCTYLMTSGLTGYLKFISVLYAIGFYKECKWFLDSIDEREMKSVHSFCICHSLSSEVEDNVSDLSQVGHCCNCISFLPTELLITPDALKYEMFKNSSLSVAVVDSNVYYFFLKFLIKKKLSRDNFSRNYMLEIDQIKHLLSKSNVRHRDVAYNLMAWCLCTEGMTFLALQNIGMSVIEILSSDFRFSHLISAMLIVAVYLYKYLLEKKLQKSPYCILC